MIQEETLTLFVLYDLYHTKRPTNSNWRQKLVHAQNF